MKTKSLMCVTCLAVSGLLTMSMAQDSSAANAAHTGKPKLSMADQKFVKDAAQGGMAEVELGNLAVQKASSDEVKKFGQRMVDDHSKANDKLKEVASQEGLTLPESPNAAQKATKTRLSKLSGDQFDKAYMNNMVKDHKQDVADFQKESSNGHDEAIKDFASQTLPTLQDHLKEARSIAPKATQARATGTMGASHQ
jgi:putative membrane protein